MIFKRLLKFTLTALLFTATAPAYADDAAEVILSSGEKVTWAKFVSAINDPSTVQGTADDTALKAAQKAYDEALAVQKDAADSLTVRKKRYDDAEVQLSDWQTQRSSYQATQGTVQSNLIKAQGKTDKVTDPWLTTAYTNAVSFQTYFNNYVSSKGQQDGTKGSIYYKFVEDEFWGSDLTISFDGLPSGENAAEWQQEVNVNTFFTALKGKKVDNTYINCGKDENGKYNYAGANGLLIVNYNGSITTLANSAATALQALTKDDEYTQYANQSERESLEKQLDTLTAQISSLTKQIDGYTNPAKEGEKSKQTVLRESYQDAQTAKDEADADVTTKNGELSTAKTAYDAALEASTTTALSYYNQVTLNNDVTATEAIKDYSGTVIGNNHVITLGQNVTALFNTFRGTLANVAVNGKIFQAQNNASYNNVASWADNIGAYYDETSQKIDNLGLDQLGYTARKFFGVDFTKKALAPKSDESIVYGITVYEPNATAHHYVQAYKKAGVATFRTENENDLNIKPNMFAKADDPDLKGKGFTNVFFNDLKSEKVVITDRQEFYCPENITAAEVEISRTFKAGQNALCLPFELSADMNSEIDALCTYDKETPKKFYFKRIGGVVAANTPMLLLAKNSFEFGTLYDVAIKKTESQMVIDEGDATDPSKCYGLLKKATRDEFQGGASESYKVYGLKDGVFEPAGENATFPAFRAVIYSDIAEPTGLMAAPRYIGILDESGADITDEFTGIGGVKADNSPSFEIAGGIGEISFTSDSDYGRVTVYTIEGKVAAVANVVAGTTTVSVPNGLYIVMGTKVLVK